MDGIIGLFLFLAVLCVCVYYLYRRSRLYFAAKKWTMSEATIQGGYAAYLEGSRYSNNYGWKPALQYSYQVAGEYYSGYLLLHGGYAFSPEDAKAATEKWTDQKITIRYNPENPQESAFLRQDGAPSGWRSMSNEAPPTTDLITLPPLK